MMTKQFPDARPGLSQEEDAAILALQLAANLNVAACYLKEEGKSSQVVKFASDALKIEPRNAKALFRRGQGYLAMNELEKAAKDVSDAHAVLLLLPLMSLFLPFVLLLVFLFFLVFVVLLFLLH